MEELKSNLAKLVNKTPINDKLLSRPPFRYLYDLITEINEKTKCFQLMDIDADNVTKEQKIDFLKSIIDQIGTDVNAKPSKIVAGMEVEQTWEFLNLIAVKATAKYNKDNEPPKLVEKKSSGKKSANVEDRKPAEKSAKLEDRKSLEKSKIPKESAEKPEITKKATDRKGLVKPEVVRKTEKEDNSSLKESLSKEKLLKKSNSQEKEKKESKPDKTFTSPYAAVRKTEIEIKKSTKSAVSPLKSSPKIEVPTPISSSKSPKSSRKKSGKNDSNEELAPPVLIRKKSTEFLKSNVVQSIVDATVMDSTKQTSFIDSSKYFYPHLVFLQSLF